MISGVNVLHLISHLIENRERRIQEDIDKRNEIGMEENRWIRTYTNPMENGISELTTQISEIKEEKLNTEKQ